MRKRVVFLATVISVLLGASYSRAEIASTKIAPGQLWSIKSRTQNTAKVIIGRIEPWRGKVAVHVSVVDLYIPPGLPGAGRLMIISHMPFEMRSLTASLDHLVAVGVPTAPSFAKGYSQWKSDPKSGIYIVSVEAAIQATFQAIGQNPDSGTPRKPLEHGSGQSKENSRSE